MNEFNTKILTNPELINQYDETSFWSKISLNTKNFGRKLLSKAFVLYYVLRDEQTPAWAKTVIYGALGYFILPLDAIPDIVPFVGFSDDLGAMVTALSIIMAHIKPKHVEMSNQALEKIFKK
jgi:uncharacterized membrane protein YkvA (DUF1232 family)